MFSHTITSMEVIGNELLGYIYNTYLDNFIQMRTYIISFLFLGKNGLVVGGHTNDRKKNCLYSFFYKSAEQLCI